MAEGEQAEPAPEPQSEAQAAPQHKSVQRWALLLRVHRLVKEIEPWSILFAVLALGLALAAFWIDYRDRVEERTVRAWQLLTTKSPGNSGKREALQYLNSEDGLLCFGSGCWVRLKSRTPLTGLDLSETVHDDGPGPVFLEGVRLLNANLMGIRLTGAQLQGADLRSSNLRGAILNDADLSLADLRGATLAGASLRGASLVGANLSYADLGSWSSQNVRRIGDPDVRVSAADLRGADLQFAALINTNLQQADLRGANLRSVHLIGADLSASNLQGVELTGAFIDQEVKVTQAQLDEACGEGTFLPAGLSIKPCE